MTLPGTAPARRVHVPPVPMGKLPDPGGATPAERAHRLQLQAAQQYTAYRASIPQGVDPDELKDNAGMYGVSDTAIALSDALKAVQADADAAVKRVNDLLDSNKVDDSDVAGQIAAQRFWARTQRSLDGLTNGAKAVNAARDIISKATAAQIPVLSEELSSYLASRGLPVDWLPQALAVKIPGMAEANADATLKQRQIAIVAGNHAILTHAFKAEIAAPPLVDPAVATSESYSNPTGA
jgi:hypothetical protein